MKCHSRSNITALAATLSLLLISSAARAVMPEPAKGGGFQSDLIGQIDDVQKKIMDLEDAVPQNKFTWRPMPGVRSVAEAYAHIAFGNYLMSKIVTGKEPPAEAGWEMNPEKWDKRTTDKAALKKMLEASFEHVHGVVKGMSDADVEKKVNFFGHEMTSRAVLIGLIGHLNEHLGQSIAYARSNKIVPPWSKTGKEMPKESAKSAAAPAKAAAADAPATVPAPPVKPPMIPAAAPAKPIK